MSWLKVDDRLFLHPKWLMTPPVARGLWITALSYCGAQNTDGLVPFPLLHILGGTEADAEALVASGLWHKEDAGYRVHDFADYNKTSDDRESLSEKRAAAGQAGGRRTQERAKQTASKNQANGKQNQAPEPEPEPVFGTYVPNDDPLPPTPEEPTNSLADTAPSRRRGSDFGVYVENILSEADADPERSHWRQALADDEAAALARGEIIRNPGARRKDRLDRWIRDPASRPIKPAPLNGPAAPRRLTPSEQRQREIAAEVDAKYAPYFAEIDRLRSDNDADPFGDTTTPPLRLAAGGFAA